MVTSSQGKRAATTTRTAISLLVCARFLGLLADQMSTFMLPVAMYTLTRDVTLSGIAFTVQWLPRVLAMPVLGVFVGRFPALRQFVLTDTTRAAVLLIVAAFPEPGVLLATSGLLTLLNGHAKITTESVFANRVASDLLSDAQSKLQGAQQLAMTTGPALGGVLLATPGLSGGVVVVAAVFVLGATITPVLARGIVLDRRVDDEQPAGPLGQLRTGAVATVRNRPLMQLMLLTILVNLIGGLALAGLPMIMVGNFGTDSSAVGLVAGAGSTASLATVVIVNPLTRRMEIGRIVAIAFALLAFSAPGMAWAPSEISFGIMYGIWSAGITVFTIWMRTRRLQLITDTQVGTTLGFFIAAILVATPISGGVLSAVGDRIDVQRLLLVVTCVVAGLIAPLAWAWWRGVRRPGDSVPHT
ncbi:Predicted arabinose efflux permease, MFS family [Actinopolyspora mzabensis]|uniref:Predicted arabinose efflux permease, MFS family n=2 Tax=Actinopolyspora mzabensis TaxID=995066 RepID=A0A1G9A1T7_ACTMZ|nr:Predicted arabinose efflux permease, MFS family [Actinopolyspora mzabensis]